MEDASFNPLFGWIDYLVFSILLALSSVIGIYYACKSNQTTHEYLFGGKKMHVFPIAMSLIASFISATTLLGTPAEIYSTGTMYCWIIISLLLAIPLVNHLFLPLYTELNISSIYEYLDLRFNSRVRRLASAAGIIKMVFYLSIVVYGPSLALSQVTGMTILTSAVVLYGVCIFYTVIGGLKAVVWTDTMQIFLMYSSLIVVIVNGIVRIGGFSRVWELNQDSGRIEFFNIKTDLTERHTVWSVTIGNFFFLMSAFSASQIQLQRFAAISSIQKAKQSMWITMFGLISIISLSCLAGLVIYAQYSTCDPMKQRRITKLDQIFPLFVMETSGHLPGIPGLFVAGVFSGALSTLSSCLSAVSLTVLEDMIRPYYPNLTDQWATYLSKFIALLFGVVCFGCVFLVANVKGILEAGISFGSSINGPVLGVFTLGIFVPWANSLGAMTGGIVSFIFMMWLSISTQIAKSQGFLRHPLKAVTIEGCLNSTFVNSTLEMNETNSTNEPSLFTEEVLPILKLSYLWYLVTAFLITIVIGLVTSLLTGKQNPKKLNPKLICNIGEKFFPFLPAHIREVLRFGVGDEYMEDNKLKTIQKEEINEGFVLEEVKKIKRVNKTNENEMTNF